MTDNAKRWEAAKFTKSTQINAQAAKIEKNRFRYEAVSRDTGVPWDVIGVIHYRESSGDFKGVLHNGQKIIGTGKLTTIVPKGRGPFSTWEEAAIDALVNAPPYAARNKDWSIAGTLDVLERYNGLGYRNKGLPSPYLWSGTDQYVSGKYVKDGVYDPNHVDQQLGCATLLLKLREGKQTTFDGGGNDGIISPPDAPVIVHVEPFTPPKHFNIWPWVLGAVILAVLFVVTQVRF